MSVWTVERLSEVGIREVAVEVVDDKEGEAVTTWRLEDHRGQPPTEDEMRGLFQEACQQLIGTPTLYSIKVRGEGESYPAVATAPIDDLQFVEQLEEACDLYERVAPLIGMRIEDLNLQDDEKEREDTWALVNQAADLALDCMKKRIPFSLVGYSLWKNGEGATHHITASDDEEMLDKAIKALALAPTVGFAFIGEGTLHDAQGKQVPALLCYIQHRSMAGPAQLFKPYRKSFLGIKLEEEDWRLARQLESSWL